MASAEFLITLMDLPEVQALIERLTEAALEHCRCCEGDDSQCDRETWSA